MFRLDCIWMGWLKIQRKLELGNSNGSIEFPLF